MQDQYVGDIGDFGKYALLKVLAGRDIVLGVVWYLTQVKGGSTDGGFIQYLSSPNEANGLGNCDKGLFDTLRDIVLGGDRQVMRVKERCILRRPWVQTYGELAGQEVHRFHQRRFRHRRALPTRRISLGCASPNFNLA